MEEEKEDEGGEEKEVVKEDGEEGCSQRSSNRPMAA